MAEEFGSDAWNSEEEFEIPSNLTPQDGNLWFDIDGLDRGVITKIETGSTVDHHPISSTLHEAKLDDLLDTFHQNMNARVHYEPETKHFGRKKIENGEVYITILSVGSPPPPGMVPTQLLAMYLAKSVGKFFGDPQQGDQALEKLSTHLKEIYAEAKECENTVLEKNDFLRKYAKSYLDLDLLLRTPLYSRDIQAMLWVSEGLMRPGPDQDPPSQKERLLNAQDRLFSSFRNPEKGHVTTSAQDFFRKVGRAMFYDVQGRFLDELYLFPHNLGSLTRELTSERSVHCAPISSQTLRYLHSGQQILSGYFDERYKKAWSKSS